MILAQNLLQQLSGNKIFILFLVSIFLFSCNTTKRSRRGSTHRPKTQVDHKKTNPNSSKIDTFNWTEIDPTTKEIDSYNFPKANPKSEYSISLMMPFKGQSEYILEEDNRNEAYINYYAGIKLALEELSNLGANFTFEVYDDEVDFNKIIYGSKFKNNDVIIGPRKKDKLKRVVGIGKRDEILVVSPWWSSNKMTENNPYYLQLNPSTKDRYDALLKHAKVHFKNEDIVIIQRDNPNDRKRSQYFQKLNTALDANIDTLDKLPIEIFTVNLDSLANGETAFDELLMTEEQRNIAVIVPNWSSKDEHYLYSCLRKLSVEQARNNITVYAMSKVLESDLIGFELYKSLKIHVATNKFIQASDKNVKFFRRKYFEKYNAICTNEAIEGYDMMLFVGKNLIQYGNNFPAILTNPEILSQLTYDIQPVYSKEDIGNENYNNIQFFQNKHVDIIYFEGFQFEKEDQTSP